MSLLLMSDRCLRQLLSSGPIIPNAIRFNFLSIRFIKIRLPIYIFLMISLLGWMNLNFCGMCENILLLQLRLQVVSIVYLLYIKFKPHISNMSKLISINFAYLFIICSMSTIIMMPIATIIVLSTCC